MSDRVKFLGHKHTTLDLRNRWSKEEFLDEETTENFKAILKRSLFCPFCHLPLEYMLAMHDNEMDVDVEIYFCNNCAKLIYVEVEELT